MRAHVIANWHSDAGTARNSAQPKPLLFQRRIQLRRFLPFRHKITYHRMDRVVGEMLRGAVGVRVAFLRSC